jgi:MerC mercury resistance protein
MKSDREGASLRADRVGIVVSAVCFVHCILTPVVLSLSAVSAHYLPSEERVHRILAVCVAAIGGFAIITGYRKHRRSRVLLLMSSGLLLIFGGAYWGDRLPSHSAEVLVTMMGSCLMISAHLINHTFCKNCSCSDERP